MSYYPDRHHPVFFLQDALQALGADAVFNGRDDRTLGCWGLIVNGKPLVWLIDNRWPHEREKEDPAAAELIRRGALVTCAQKPDAERVGAKWLPLAVTPGYRPPDKPVERLYDVGFVGYVRDAGREAVLRHVSRHFKLCVERGVFGDAAVNLYWQSRIALNVPTQYGEPNAYDSANMRFFEALGAASVLATPFQPYLSELGIGRLAPEVLSYATIGGLIDGIEKRLRMGDQLAERGSLNAKLAQERHTYTHRAKKVLEWLK